MMMKKDPPYEDRRVGSLTKSDKRYMDVLYIDPSSIGPDRPGAQQIFPSPALRTFFSLWLDAGLGKTIV